VRTISATNFLTGMYQTVLNVVLQRFVVVVTGSVSALGLLGAFGGRYGLVGSLVQPSGGALADVRGRRFAAMAGASFSMAAMGLLVLAALFQGRPWALPALLLPAFLCMGLGMISAPALASSIAESSTPGRSASAYATTVFFWVLPGALLAIPGGLLADRLGYHAVFGMAFAFEAANLTLFALFLRETSAPTGARWRPRIDLGLRPPPEVRTLYWIGAMDSFSWGLAAGIIYGLIAAEFRFSNVQLTGIAAAWALSFALFLPPTAAFVNRIGLRKVMIFSESLGVPIMLGWLFATRIEHFLLVSVLNGMTAATWVPTTQAYLADWLPKERRARAVGGFAAFRGLVAFPAPFLGGLLYDTFGYAAPIIANLTGAIVTTIAVAAWLRNPPRREPADRPSLA
jgi:MFS family permease